MAYTYSFLDVSAAINGPNGSFSLSDGNAEGGITVARRTERNTLTIGADGTPMNSLHADRSGMITVRLLKTSATNAMLQSMYDADAADTAAWGNNTIVVRDANLGDEHDATAVAFQKFPDVVYDKEGPALEWTFTCGAIDSVLGTGAAWPWPKSTSMGEPTKSPVSTR